MDGEERAVIRSTPWTFLINLVPALFLVPAVWVWVTGGPGDRGPVDTFFAGLAGLLLLITLYRTAAWLIGPQLNRYEVGRYTLTARTLWRSTSLEWHTIDTVEFVGSRLRWFTTEPLKNGSLRLRVRTSGVWHDLPSLLVRGDERHLQAWTVVSTACERHRVELQTEIVKPE